MKRYVLADAARSDLIEIWDYLAEHSGMDVADRILTDLHKTMGKLAEDPLVGHRREDLTDQSVRFHLIHSYLVIYKPDTTPLAIARVLHASRDVLAILEQSQ
jgi:plasmid stabilization system protein ParE